MSKFIFMGSLFGPFWSAKNTWILLWHQNFVPFDSENIRIKESKKPGFTFSVELRNKFVWAHGLKWSGDGSLKVKTSEHIWQS